MISHVRTDAPAKLNLRLLVLARETSGYHSLETIFCALSLSDRITVARGRPGVELEVISEHVDTGPPDQNLVVKAARAFYERLGRDPEVRIRLQKRIPSEAGLGGGSSDAAATLRALSALHPGGLDHDELIECAASLGSDVPFFLAPVPFALAWGRGDRMLALKPPPRRTVVVVHPGVGISTPEAYQTLDDLRPAASPPVAGERSVLDHRALSDWLELARLARNDFDAVARERIPAFEHILKMLTGAGAEIAMLSGSGSAIFGIFQERAAARAASASIDEAGFRAWTALTLARWPSVDVHQT